MVGGCVGYTVIQQEAVIILNKYAVNKYTRPFDESSMSMQCTVYTSV